MHFRSLPVTIEAFRLSREVGVKLALWCGGVWTDLYGRGDNGEDISHISIDTLEGTMRANLGDWIIKGLRGEFYPCKPDVFRMKYEAAPLLISVCGRDCNPGDDVCNNYCNLAPEKGPMVNVPPPGVDAEEYKGFRMS